MAFGSQKNSLRSPSDKPKRPADQNMDTLIEALDTRLHALIICLSQAWGGLEQVTVTDSVQLLSCGLDIEILCLEGSPTDIHFQESLEPEIYNKYVRRVSYKPKNFFDFKLRSEILKYVEEGVNLIHTHQTSLLTSIIPWVWNQTHVSVVASRHIMNNHNKRNFFHAALYRRLDALVVMSRTLRENVLATHVLKERQVKVVHLGLDFLRFTPSKYDPTDQREEWGADEETVVIGIVGRIDPAKGQETFIKAAAGLMKSELEGIKLKFVVVGEETVGGDRKYMQSLNDILQQFRIAEHFVFAGFQENIPNVMAALDIFVMPSRQEAFGLVAIEAMAMECPIIISSGGSADEIVGQEEFGLLVRPEDAFDLQRQIGFLLRNPELRKKMGIRAREHVLKNYDRKIRLQRTLALYERLLRRRGV